MLSADAMTMLELAYTRGQAVALDEAGEPILFGQRSLKYIA